MYEQDLALNNLQGLICHKTQLIRIHLYKVNQYLAHSVILLISQLREE